MLVITSALIEMFIVDLGLTDIFIRNCTVQGRLGCSSKWEQFVHVAYHLKLTNNPIIA